MDDRQSPGYYTVGSEWTNRGVVGCNKSNKKRKVAHKITCEPLIDRD